MVGYEKWRLIFRNSFSLGIIFEIRGEDRFISCTKEYAVSKPEGGADYCEGVVQVEWKVGNHCLLTLIASVFLFFLFDIVN